MPHRAATQNSDHSQQNLKHPIWGHTTHAIPSNTASSSRNKSFRCIMHLERRVASSLDCLLSYILVVEISPYPSHSCTVLIIRKETRRLLRVVPPAIIELRGRRVRMPSC